MKFPFSELQALQNALAESGTRLEGILLKDKYMFEDLECYVSTPETGMRTYSVMTPSGIVKLISSLEIRRQVHQYVTDKLGEWRGV